VTPDASVRAVEAVVHGRVQGVGFRWFVLRQAAVLDVSGWVANELDGAVRVVAEGPAEDVELLLAALREGPAGADVTEVSVTEHPATGGFERFTVRSGWHSGD
jgi:acylphosphatase